MGVALQFENWLRARRLPRALLGSVAWRRLVAATKPPRLPWPSAWAIV